MPSDQRKRSGSQGGSGRKGGFGLGPGGKCVCPQCGKEAPHQRGAPCYQTRCSECGTPMIRKRSSGS